MDSTLADTIVVGGGPAGSATAAMLARRGYRVTLLDRAAFPRAKPCGDYLNPGCDAILDRLGVHDSLEGAGARRVRGMCVVAPDGRTLVLPFPRASGWALPRHTLDHLLLRHASGEGVKVIEEARVVAVEQMSRGAVIHAERPRMRRIRFAARLVIGADGLRSAVAGSIGAGGPPRRGRYTVGTYLGGLAPGAGGEETGEIHLGHHRYCGVAYLPGGLANVTIALSRGELRAWRGDLEARYWEALRTFPGLADRLGHARRVGGFRTSGPLAYWRRRAASGRVLLVGDAAAYVDPLTGQGIFLALRGAELAAGAAAAALNHDDAAAAALRGYARGHAEEFGSTLLVSRLLQALAFCPAVVRRATRRMAVHPDLGTHLIGAVGNVEPAGSVLRPGFLARVLGIA